MTKSIKRKIVGTVVSDKMLKTVVVRIEVIKVHPKYKKRYHVYRKYVAHNEHDEVKVGDKVEIEEMRSKSKTKHWTVLRKF